MTNKERRASKYLPFDALKGLHEQIRIEDAVSKMEQFPELSEDELIEMNGILFDCYSKNKAIVISYYENGSFHHYSGVIAKIDIINKQIILLPKKKFNISCISKISAKGT